MKTINQGSNLPVIFSVPTFAQIHCTSELALMRGRGGKEAAIHTKSVLFIEIRRVCDHIIHQVTYTVGLHKEDMSDMDAAATRFFTFSIVSM